MSTHVSVIPSSKSLSVVFSAVFLLNPTRDHTLILSSYVGDDRSFRQGVYCGGDLAVTDNDTVSVDSFYRGGGRDTDPRGCVTPGRPGGILAALWWLRWKDVWMLFPPDLFVSWPQPASRRVHIYGWFLAAGITIRTLTDHHILLRHAVKWQKEEIVA